MTPSDPTSASLGLGPGPGPVSAPGKSFLIGEYAVLEGHTAIVTAVDVRAYAHTPRSQHGELADPSSPFVAAAAQLTAGWLSGHGHVLPDPDALPIVTTVGFTAGNRKLGLGSSAAVTAAVVGWLLRQAGLDPTQGEQREAALSIAREAHTMAQEGRGSGADVAVAVHGQTLRFAKSGELSPVELPTWLHIAFFDGGAPASTGSFVKAVEAGAQREPEAYATAIAKLAGASTSFQAGIARAHAAEGFAELRQACTAHNEGLRGLQELGRIPILTPTINTIVAHAEAHGLAAKPSGAGGGDLVVVFAPDAASLDHLAVELYERETIPRVRELETHAQGLRAESRPPVNSRIRALYKRRQPERREAISIATGIPLDRFAAVDPAALDPETAEHMSENVIGTLALPLGVATNVRINGRDYLVPMCVEEASVVAAASNAAKMVRSGGGFAGFADPPWMIAQIQLMRSDERETSVIAAKIHAARDELLAIADAAHPRLVARGGGAREVEVRLLDHYTIVVHVLVDCRDAMGANLVNTVAEALAPRLETLTSWRAVLRILSNLADRRASHVSCEVPVAALVTPDLDGESVALRIEEASRFAELDPYRAATHNKGIMNGVDALVLATGNDWRAMEASAHAFAVKDGRYGPLATWRRVTLPDDPGVTTALRGEISLPTAVGVVGGATRIHPSARLALEILGHPSGSELGLVMAAVGLASNLAALRALATEGIQRGHMSLHARTVALTAGARGAEVESLAARLIAVGEIKPERARALLGELRSHRDA